MQRSLASVGLSNGDFVLFDLELGKFLVTDPGLNPIAAYGSPGSFDMQFDRPSLATVAPDDSIYVWDSGNSRMQVVTASGQHLGSFTLPSQVKQISDIDIDSDYNLYIADEGEHQIHVLELVGYGDATAPSTQVSTSPAANGAGWNSADVTVSLAATDNTGGSGVKEIRYSVNMGTEQVVAGATATFTLSTAGTNTIAFYAVDNKGNIETTQYRTVKIDKAAGTTTVSVSPTPNSAGWTKASTTVTLSASDAVSGVKEIRHKTNSDAEQTTAGSSASVVLSTSGTHVVAYRSLDNADNIEVSQSTTVKVDVTAPDVNGSEANRVVSLSASDAHSGILRIQYQVDGGSTQTYSGPVTLASTAKSMKYWSEDVAGNLSVQKTIQVGQSVSGITVTPTVLYAGATAAVKVTIGSAAPTGGTVVALSSSDANVLPLPATVTVPAGATFVTTNVVLGPVSTDTTVYATATVGSSSVTQGMVVLVPVPKSLTLLPSLVSGGATSVATLTLVSKAPAGGQVVAVSSMDSSTAQVPATVTVAAGATSVKFNVTTTAVGSDKSVLLVAEVDGTSVVAMLAVRRVGVSKLLLTPPSVVGGVSSTAKLTLSRPAPTGGLVVQLASSDSVAQVPATITVPAGATTASFTVSTSPVASTRVASIQARCNGTTVRDTVTMNPPVLDAVKVLPTLVVGGASATGTVSLTGKAPSGGVIVTLSSNSVHASVPASVTIPAGASSVDFAIATTAVTADVSATIGASRGTVSKTAVLKIKP